MFSVVQKDENMDTAHKHKTLFVLSVHRNMVYDIDGLIKSAVRFPDRLEPLKKRPYGSLIVLQFSPEESTRSSQHSG